MDQFQYKIPQEAFDLSESLGYGLIFQPIIAQVNPNVHPIFPSVSRDSVKKVYRRLKTKKYPK